jgi:hypothetical protein
MQFMFNSAWQALEGSLDDAGGPETIPPSERNERAILEEILESIRGADAQRYLVELRKPLEDRRIEFFMLTTAIHTVIRWVLREKLGVPFTHRLHIDYEIVIGEKIALIETKIGNLLEQPYLQATLDQVEKAYMEFKAATAIIVIPDHPDIADQLNSEKSHDWLQFCRITELECYLSKLKQDEA